VVQGIIKCLDSRNKGVFFLTGEDNLSLGQLFEIIAKKLGKKFEFDQKHIMAKTIYLTLLKNIRKMLHRADLISYFMTGEKGRIHRIYSTSKIRGSMGYSPKIGLNEGIDRTIEEFRKEGKLK
jgi:nucleoside-diphosphate-sugar epimerase